MAEKIDKELSDLFMEIVEESDKAIDEQKDRRKNVNRMFMDALTLSDEEYLKSRKKREMEVDL